MLLLVPFRRMLVEIHRWRVTPVDTHTTQTPPTSCPCVDNEEFLGRCNIGLLVVTKLSFEHETRIVSNVTR